LTQTQELVLLDEPTSMHDPFGRRCGA